MKRIKGGILTISLAAIMAGGLLTGCGSLEAEDNIVYVQKKGKVQTLDVEAFDKSYYSAEGFKAFAQEAIDAYNMSHETDAVTLTEFTLEENAAKLEMEYKTVEDYSAFNEITLYQGTIAEAVGEGYLFDVDFSKVEKGEVTGSATRSDILEEDGLSVVIIKANTNVKVGGNICYVSSENVTVTEKDTVSIYDEENTSLTADVCTYIIYK